MFLWILFIPTICLSMLATLIRPGLPAAGNRPGVVRHSPIGLHPTFRSESPTVAVDKNGRIAVAFVAWQQGRERIMLRWAHGPGLPLSDAREVSKGMRASHPGLAAHPDGSMWLVWCGLNDLEGGWKKERSVFIRRVGPGEPGRITRVSESNGWSCAPKISIEPDLQGKIHVVWEKEYNHRIHIAYRSFTSSGKAIGTVETVSHNVFARRPSVLATVSGVHVAWDELVSNHPTGEPDPDYDVLLRSRLKGKWKPVVQVDDGPGIQAAPSLAVDTRGDILVAYHSTRSGPLIKWWTVRKVRSTQVEEIAVADQISQSKPTGEIQGAEFPVLLVAKNRIVVVSRSSQAARLHALDASGVGVEMDLSSPGWGARGIQAGIAEARDGSILVVRKGRKQLFLERLVFDDTPLDPAVFKPVDDRPKKKKDKAGWFLPSGMRNQKPAARASYRLLMGDLHMHSAMSDGTGTVDENLARAWTRGLDFAALTDHDVLVGFEMMPSKFDETAWISDLFEARYAMIALHAFEWTSVGWPKGFGHRNVYFRETRPEQLCLSNAECDHTHALHAWAKRHQAVSIPHHTSWTGTEWGSKNESITRLLEVVSIHGAFEFAHNEPIRPRGEMQNMFARDALMRGYKIGFVGGSDSHGLLWHHGVGWREDPWLGGLTGLFAQAKRRQDVFDALLQRRCYATSGVPVFVWLRAGEIEMGSEGRARRPIVLEYQISSSLQLKSLEIVRDGRLAVALKPAGTCIKGTWEDPINLESGWHSYYLRIRLRDRQPAVAWSSPVFIDIEKPEED